LRAELDQAVALQLREPRQFVGKIVGKGDRERLLDGGDRQDRNDSGGRLKTAGLKLLTDFRFARADVPLYSASSAPTFASRKLPT